MDPLLLKEKEKYTFLWDQVPEYREQSPGETALKYFLRQFDSQIKPGDKIIDFGCGTGRVARNFLARGLDVTLVDFCSNCLDPEIELLLSLFPERIRFVEACLWDLPQDLHQAEWIYCCDVLEHIPEEKMELVLKGFRGFNLKGGHFNIALKEDLFGISALNAPLHLCVQDKDWWAKKILSHWQIECMLIDAEEIYLGCSIKVP